MTSAEWVRAENRPSGCRLSGREISMGKKSAAVALPELLDLIEHCREALDPALWHLIENGAESGDGATDARYPVLDPALRPRAQTPACPEWRSP